MEAVQLLDATLAEEKKTDEVLSTLQRQASIEKQPEHF